MPDDLVFERRSRSQRMLLILVAVYGGLIALVVTVDAAGWLMALLALPTLPALYDVLKDTRAGLRLSQERLDWYTGKRQGALYLNEIEHMRFDTRWDFSIRVTAYLIGDKKLRLPYEAIPPHRAFEAALTARGVAVKRHHFTVF